MLVGRERAGFDGLDVVADRFLHHGLHVAELLGEGRRAVTQPQHVVDDEHLAVAVGTGTDADGRDVQCRSHLRSEVGRDVFEHERERPRFLVGACEVENLLGVLLGCSLSLVAGRLDLLGRQAEMRHHGNPELDQSLGQLDGVRAGLQLDRVGVRLLEHPAAVLDALGLADADREEGHIGDDDGVARRAGDGGRPARDLFDRHGKRRVVAQRRVAHAVADEHEVGSRPVDDGRRRRVVRGQHRDSLGPGLRADVPYRGHTRRTARKREKRLVVPPVVHGRSSEFAAVEQMTGASGRGGAARAGRAAVRTGTH